MRWWQLLGLVLTAAAVAFMVDRYLFEDSFWFIVLATLVSAALSELGKWRMRRQRRDNPADAAN